VTDYGTFSVGNCVNGQAGGWTFYAVGGAGGPTGCCAGGGGGGGASYGVGGVGGGGNPGVPPGSGMFGGGGGGNGDERDANPTTGSDGVVSLAWNSANTTISGYFSRRQLTYLLHTYHITTTHRSVVLHNYWI